MTKEEAIRILDPETTKEELVGIKGYAAMMKVVDEACILAVSALREQEKRRWIPVTERLPDKPMKCLVYTKRGECYGYDIACYNQGFYLQYANVTHWMPLPEPPKEGDEG